MFSPLAQSAACPRNHTEAHLPTRAAGDACWLGSAAAEQNSVDHQDTYGSEAGADVGPGIFSPIEIAHLTDITSEQSPGHAQQHRQHQFTQVVTRQEELYHC